jgi:hypothetical protein
MPLSCAPGDTVGPESQPSNDRSVVSLSMTPLTAARVPTVAPRASGPSTRTHVHDAILAPGHRHHIDPAKWRPLIMNFLGFYGLGEQLQTSRLAKVF